MDAAFFEIRNLSKKFGGIKAVDDASFEVGRDEIVGLIGPNGAGKTTILRLILGILKADSGTVRFKGKDITNYPIHKIVNEGIAGTFQNTKPFHDLPIIANVIVGCMSSRALKRGEWVKRVEEKAMDTLEFCGIADLALEKASILSQGDLKRLEVAKAIATEPELLIVDEPFGGLSPAETTLMADSLNRLHRGGRFGRLHSEGPAIVLIEHKLEALMRIVDRIVVLNFGQVIASGSPQEIVENEQVIKAYYMGRRKES
jgi:branched-chain amino acid transport system ATP-binding protein